MRPRPWLAVADDRKCKPVAHMTQTPFRFLVGHWILIYTLPFACIPRHVLLQLHSNICGIKICGWRPFCASACIFISACKGMLSWRMVDGLLKFLLPWIDALNWLQLRHRHLKWVFVIQVRFKGALRYLLKSADHLTCERKCMARGKHQDAQAALTSNCLGQSPYGCQMHELQWVLLYFMTKRCS